MIAVGWRHREPPLAPAAVVAAGEARERMRMRLLEAGESSRRWSGVASASLIVVLGDELPWVDGAIYLGRDPDALELLLPTTLAPDVPATLLARALLARFPAALVPLAAFPIEAASGRSRVISLAGARPIAGSVLEERT